MFVTFVIPCYRSEITLPKVVDEIKATMEALKKYDYEIVLVNDASPDNTWGAIEQLVKTNKNITGINFAKNFGQHSGLMAGLRESKGD